jgi:hypothetical protein
VAAAAAAAGSTMYINATGALAIEPTAYQNALKELPVTLPVALMVSDCMLIASLIRASCHAAGSSDGL